METIGLIIGLAAWLFIDIFLGLRIKQMKSSSESKTTKLVLYGVNVLFALVAITFALMVY